MNRGLKRNLIITTVLLMVFMFMFASAVAASDPQPKYIYYQVEDNDTLVWVRADYMQAVDDLLDEDSTLRDAIAEAILNAIGAGRTVYVEDEDGNVINYTKANKDDVRYPAAAVDLDEYGVEAAPEAEKELVVDPDTGEAVLKPITEIYEVTFEEANKLEGVEITISSNGAEASSLAEKLQVATAEEIDTITTDADGEATIDLPDGEYTYTATKDDYEEHADAFEVDGEDKSIEFEMELLVELEVVSLEAISATTLELEFNRGLDEDERDDAEFEVEYRENENEDWEEFEINVGDWSDDYDKIELVEPDEEALNAGEYQGTVTGVVADPDSAIAVVEAQTETSVNIVTEILRAVDDQTITWEVFDQYGNVMYDADDPHGNADDTYIVYNVTEGWVIDEDTSGDMTAVVNLEETTDPDLSVGDTVRVTVIYEEEDIEAYKEFELLEEAEVHTFELEDNVYVYCDAEDEYVIAGEDIISGDLYGGEDSVYVAYTAYDRYNNELEAIEDFGTIEDVVSIRGDGNAVEFDDTFVVDDDDQGYIELDIISDLHEDAADDIYVRTIQYDGNIHRSNEVEVEVLQARMPYSLNVTKAPDEELAEFQTTDVEIEVFDQYGDEITEALGVYDLGNGELDAFDAIYTTESETDDYVDVEAGSDAFDDGHEDTYDGESPIEFTLEYVDAGEEEVTVTLREDENELDSVTFVIELVEAMQAISVEADAEEYSAGDTIGLTVEALDSDDEVHEKITGEYESNVHYSEGDQNYTRILDFDAGVAETDIPATEAAEKVTITVSVDQDAFWIQQAVTLEDSTVVKVTHGEIASFGVAKATEDPVAVDITALDSEGNTVKDYENNRLMVIKAYDEEDGDQLSLSETDAEDQLSVSFYEGVAAEVVIDEDYAYGPEDNIEYITVEHDGITGALDETFEYEHVAWVETAEELSNELDKSGVSTIILEDETFDASELDMRDYGGTDSGFVVQYPQTLIAAEGANPVITLDEGSYWPTIEILNDAEGTRLEGLTVHRENGDEGAQAIAVRASNAEIHDNTITGQDNHENVVGIAVLDGIAPPVEQEYYITNVSITENDLIGFDEIEIALFAVYDGSIEDTYIHDNSADDETVYLYGSLDDIINTDTDWDIEEVVFAPDSLKLAGETDITSDNEPVTEQYTATVVDEFGNAVEGVQVDFDATAFNVGDVDDVSLVEGDSGANVTVAGLVSDGNLSAETNADGQVIIAVTWSDEVDETADMTAEEQDENNDDTLSITVDTQAD